MQDLTTRASENPFLEGGGEAVKSEAPTKRWVTLGIAWAIFCGASPKILGFLNLWKNYLNFSFHWRKFGLFIEKRKLKFGFFIKESLKFWNLIPEYVPFVGAKTSKPSTGRLVAVRGLHTNELGSPAKLENISNRGRLPRATDPHPVTCTTPQWKRVS